MRVNVMPLSSRTTGERHGNEVTPVEIQRPAGPPCLSVVANKGREKKRGASQFVLSSPSPPLPLCLDFIWQVGGVKGEEDWGEGMGGFACRHGRRVSLKREPLCVYVRASLCMRELILILQSLVIIPRQSLTMPFGHPSSLHPSPLHRPFTHTRKPTKRSDLCETSSTCTYRSVV